MTTVIRDYGLGVVEKFVPPPKDSGTIGGKLGPMFKGTAHAQVRWFMDGEGAMLQRPFPKDTVHASQIVVAKSWTDREALEDEHPWIGSDCAYRSGLFCSATTPAEVAWLTSTATGSTADERERLKLQALATNLLTVKAHQTFDALMSPNLDMVPLNAEDEEDGKYFAAFVHRKVQQLDFLRSKECGELRRSWPCP